MPAIAVDGLSIHYEEAGDPADPAILLIMGLGTQLIAWPEALVDALVARGFRVIRYDNRDIGKSTYLHDAPAPNPLWALFAKRVGLPVGIGYTLGDMAQDAVALLDALGIDRAHVVGASMGGMIAQLLGIDAPDRVTSLVSIMSSSGAPGLPGPTPELRRRMIARRPANPTRDQAIAMGVATLELIAYPDPARAADAFETAAAASFDRGYNPDGARRHLLAIIADGSRATRLAKVRAPTLVIHGRADPLVPHAASEDIARRVPGARLELIDEMAHDLPPSQVARLATLIADHAAAAERAA